MKMDNQNPQVIVIDTETTGHGHIRGRPDGIVQVGYATRIDGKVEG
jgi:DNA polymerase III epsilon subunit-like protein